jgi:hypothetical protein
VRFGYQAGRYGYSIQYFMTKLGGVTKLGDILTKLGAVLAKFEDVLTKLGDAAINWKMH